MARPHPHPSRPLRQRQLAAIHLAKRDLGLDEENYRRVLRNATGLESAGEMTDEQRGKVLSEMRRRGFHASSARAEPRSLGRRPHNFETNPQYSKIEALLHETGKGWGYAAGIGSKMFGKAWIEMCSAAELRGIITALEKYRSRHESDEKEIA